jgi:hypothetical protein
MAQFDTDAARAEGWSDEEISQFLLSQPGVAEAKAEGYSDEEILGHMGFQPLASQWGPGYALATGATLGQWPRIAGALGIEDTAKLEAARSAYSRENPLLAGGLEIAGSIPTTMAAMALVPEIAAPAALGRLAPLASRVMTQGARGGVAGTAMAPLSPETTISDLPGEIALGAGLGAAFPLAGAAIAPAIAPAMAQAVRAAEGLGVKLRPGQFSMSRAMAKLDDLLVRSEVKDTQLRDFTKAVSRTIGEDTDVLTTDVLDDAAERIGRGLDDFATRAKVNYTPQLDSKLTSALQEINISPGLAKSDAKQLLDVVADIRKHVALNNNQLTGKMYRSLTQRGSMLSDLSRNSNPTIRRLGGEIADELFNAMEASSPSGVAQDLLALKDQYKNLMMIEPLVKAAGPSGIIDPRKVARLARADKDLGTLSAVGKLLPTPTEIGLAKTPKVGARITMGAALGVGGLGEAYLATHDPVLAAKAAAAATALYGLKRGAGAAMASDWFRRLALGASAPPGVNPFVPAVLGVLPTPQLRGTEQ